jgi:hypothetical protein
MTEEQAKANSEIEEEPGVELTDEDVEDVWGGVLHS